MISNPPKKEKFLDKLAEENGVAIVVVNEESKAVSVSNNNSMCRSLYSSEEFAPRCDQFCGKAFAAAAKAGETVQYECHAGLTCKAVPVWEGGKQFVAIVGRTFLKAENYRLATEKAITGEWRQFRPTEFFENVLINGSDHSLDRVVARLEKFSKPENDDILEVDRLRLEQPEVSIAEPAAVPEPAMPDPNEITNLINKFKTETENAAGELQKTTSTAVQSDPNAAAEWRSLFGSLMNLEYRDACRAILSHLKKRYDLGSLIWLERRDAHLEVLVGIGELADKAIKIGVTADNQRLADAARREMPLEFRERRKGGDGSERTLSVFPVTIGNDVRGAIGIDSRIESPEQKRVIARFAQTLASQLEILRLRDEVSQRDWLSRAVIRFNESLRRIDADDFWLRITQISAELVNAERASILVHNEKSNSLHAKAAIGSRINLLSEPSVGGRVASRILEIGDPVVVTDMKGVESAPVEWSYKTNSFISYPILIGDRRIGVLNFTDKAGGENFSERDLELLQAIAPQIAVAIDRTTLRDKAGEYEQLSVTDPLTGLLNRRYLEERLAEEITRSKRHRFSMCLMMLDVDKFKSYNDSFGHPAGDSALKAVADILKDTLRGADVASRYGGEEFAILLPQTSTEEAAQIGERIRKRVERTEFSKRQVTVSIGIAGISNEIDTPKDLISAADVALYAAKNHGRNNVQIFNALGDSITENIH